MNTILINNSNVAIHKDNLNECIVEQKDYLGCKLKYKGTYGAFKVYRIVGHK